MAKVVILTTVGLIRLIADGELLDLTVESSFNPIPLRLYHTPNNIESKPPDQKKKTNQLKDIERLYKNVFIKLWLHNIQPEFLPNS